MKIDIVNSDSNETFIITFNVTNGPPTHIVCVGPGDFTVNETSNLVNRTIIDKETTGVSIGLVERQDGMIQCNVSNARVIQETINGIMAIAATTSLTIKTEGIYTDQSSNNNCHFNDQLFSVNYRILCIEFQVY